MSDDRGADGNAGEPVHAVATIGPELARKAALVVTRDRFVRPVTGTLTAILAVIAIVFFVIGPIWVGIVIVVVGGAGPALAYLTVPKVAAHLQATGFAPGTVLVADYFDDHVVLQTGGSSNTLPYDEISRVRVTRHLAVLRRRGQAHQFLLPVAAVPPEVRDRFGARA